MQPGARAVTVPVDEVSSQGGLVRPGDRVDLMLTEERQDDGERCVSIRPLLESVRVLATGRATREPGTAAGNPDSGSERWTADSYSTMTLDVTPDQAQQLAAGQRLGDIVPMLRGEGDLAPSGLDPRGSGRGACRTPSVVADTSAPTQPALAVDLLVGGRQRLTVTRHWVRESPTEE
ncbi:MAG: Flp pilus assembly protein CpaB [Steroidobacteraceae bacterium]